MNANSKPELTAEVEEAYQAVMVWDNATQAQRTVLATYLKAKAAFAQAEKQMAEMPTSYDEDYVAYHSGARMN